MPDDADASSSVALIIVGHGPLRRNVATFDVLFTGYAGAVERFQAAATSQDAGQAFIPAFEALNWAVALDDRTGKHFTPEGKPLGLRWRTRVILFVGEP